MTDLQRLSIVSRLIRSHSIILKMRANKNRKAVIPNGRFYPECDIIKVYYRNRKEEAAAITSVLLHEFGHWLLTQDWGPWPEFHTERHAWEVGLRCVPENVLPSNYKALMVTCLLTYGDWDSFEGYELCPLKN